MIHDIGAYRTNKITDDLDYDTETSGTAHAVIWRSVFKTGITFRNSERILLCTIICRIPKSAEPITSTAGIAMYLYLLEEVDSLFRQYGEALDTKVFEEESEIVFFRRPLRCCFGCIRQENMLNKLESGVYRQELQKFMENVLFTNEEKETTSGLLCTASV